MGEWYQIEFLDDYRMWEKHIIYYDRDKALEALRQLRGAPQLSREWRLVKMTIEVIEEGPQP